MLLLTVEPCISLGGLVYGQFTRVALLTLSVQNGSAQVLDILASRLHSRGNGDASSIFLYCLWSRPSDLSGDPLEGPDPNVGNYSYLIFFFE